MNPTPLLRAIPVVLARPHGKRMPKGFRFNGGRRGTNADSWCAEWRAFCATWPGVITDDMRSQAESVFKYETQEKVEIGE